MPRPWTLHEIAEATRMRMGGMTVYAIARELGRSETAVGTMLSNRGVVVYPRMTEDERVFLRDNYREHGTAYCARRLGRTRDAVKMLVYTNRSRIFGEEETDV